MSYDLRAFQTNIDGSISQALADATTSGSRVEGVEKLAQRFLIILLTPRGTMPYLPLQGTNFVNILKRGLHSESDLFAAFAASTVDVARQMRLVEKASDPDSEKFSKASLQQAKIFSDRVEIIIKLENKAGGAITISWPLIFSLIG